MSNYYQSYLNASLKGDSAAARYFWDLMEVEKRNAEHQRTLQEQGKQQTELLRRQSQALEDQARATRREAQRAELESYAAAAAEQARIEAEEERARRQERVDQLNNTIRTLIEWYGEVVLEEFVLNGTVRERAWDLEGFTEASSKAEWLLGMRARVRKSLCNLTEEKCLARVRQLWRDKQEVEAQEEAARLAEKALQARAEDIRRVARMRIRKEQLATTGLPDTVLEFILKKMDEPESKLHQKTSGVERHSAKNADAYLMTSYIKVSLGVGIPLLLFFASPVLGAVMGLLTAWPTVSNVRRIPKIKAVAEYLRRVEAQDAEVPTLDIALEQARAEDHGPRNVQSVAKDLGRMVARSALSSLGI